MLIDSQDNVFLVLKNLIALHVGNNRFYHKIIIFLKLALTSIIFFQILGKFTMLQ